jgi:putative endonuclease
VKGYRIVARNLRSPQGEIDVVVRRGRVLVFIEMKYRADIGLAQDAVTARQWQRIARAAAQFVGAPPKPIRAVFCGIMLTAPLSA